MKRKSPKLPRTTTCQKLFDRLQSDNMFSPNRLVCFCVAIVLESVVKIDKLVRLCVAIAIAIICFIDQLSLKCSGNHLLGSLMVTLTKV